ncbi:GYDIA family GHMP kinase [Kordia sp.]|uniref:GYDIA family GHMP kinase n=1 Tax=Kordia sp. TaxID=1965332 RepID=UPI003D2BB79D
MNFYSNGKLLLTGEYVVLDGAKALAIPTAYGQSLVVTPIEDSKLVWESADEQGAIWFQHDFELNSITASARYTNEVSQTLHNLLAEAKRLNPSFLNETTGFHVKTNLTFPRNWGLGSSSTLIHNIALWANVNPFTLLWNAFKGSGYDIACAKHNSPIIYETNQKEPIVTEVTFQPSFSDQLYFVHLNKKQNSRNAINNYTTRKGKIANEIKVINAITSEMIVCKSMIDFKLLLQEHEAIISTIIQEVPVQERLFADYFGQTKSLGAWGGDFILATGNTDTPSYFTAKGHETVIPFDKMILSGK